MQITNIHQAKTNLSKLIEKTINGQDVIIAKAGRPVARLIKFEEITSPRIPGRLKGKISVPADFNEENEEINQLFAGH